MGIAELRTKKADGFTLTELIIAVAISGLVLGAVYSTYRSQQDTSIAQAQVAEMQQNIRAALHLMIKDIRMAGYDPTGETEAGILANLPAPNDTFGATSNGTAIAFTIDADASGIAEDNDTEQRAYRFDNINDRIERFNASNDTWQSIIENIDGLDLVYLDRDGNVTADLEDVRSVQVSILTRSSKIMRDFVNNSTYSNQQDPPTWTFTAPGDKYRRRLLTTTVRCRNMGI